MEISKEEQLDNVIHSLSETIQHYGKSHTIPYSKFNPACDSLTEARHVENLVLLIKELRKELGYEPYEAYQWRLIFANNNEIELKKSPAILLISFLNHLNSSLVKSR